ncbi:hypothetical protein D3C73_1020470 [compost metagenome]
MDGVGEGFIFLPALVGMAQDEVDLRIAFSVDHSGRLAVALRIPVNIDQLGHFLIGGHRRLDRNPGIFIGEVPVIIRYFRCVVLLRMHGADSALLQSVSNI